MRPPVSFGPRVAPWCNWQHASLWNWNLGFESLWRSFGVGSLGLPGVPPCLEVKSLGRPGRLIALLPSPRMRPPYALIVALAAAALLAGCGGGGDETTESAPATTETTALTQAELLERGDAIC